MKILKPKKVVKSVTEEVEKPKRVIEDEEYPDLLDKKELVLGESNKLVFSVARGGEYGLPMIDIRHYVDTKKYSGPTKKAVITDTLKSAVLRKTQRHFWTMQPAAFWNREQHQ